MSDLTELTRGDLKDMGLKRLEIKRMFRHEVCVRDDRSRAALVDIEEGAEFDSFLAELATSLELDASPASLSLFMVMPDERRLAVRKLSSIQPGRDLELAVSSVAATTGASAAGESSVRSS